MSNNLETGGLDRSLFQIEPSTQLIGVFEALAAIYEEVGLPQKAAREAALADLECSFTTLPLAA
jgi:hypothetical protein